MVIEVSSKNARNIVKLAVGYLIICADSEYDFNFLILTYGRTFSSGKLISNISS